MTKEQAIDALKALLSKAEEVAGDIYVGDDRRTVFAMSFPTLEKIIETLQS